MTGYWTGEPPEAESPAMPAPGGFAGFIGSMRGGPDDRLDPLTRAMRARDEPEEPFDDDDRSASLLARRYSAGQLTDLSQKLGEATAELEAERERIGKGEREAERVRGMLERGQISALDASRRLDGDFGDVHTAERLERRCQSLQRQIADATAIISPQRQPDLDPVEAASRRAHETFRQVTRQRMAEAEAGRPYRARRPFGGRGLAVRSEVTCAECIQAGATDEESFLIHSDPSPPPVPAADTRCGNCGLLVDFCSCARVPLRRSRLPVSFDSQGHEIARAYAG